MDLFNQTPLKDLKGTPLPERVRPESLSEVFGQAKALLQIKKYLHSNYLPSMIFWGPPGTGKTSLGLALAKEFQAHFVAINAVDSGAKILKDLGEQARLRRRIENQLTLLFVDEIHRFNKAQQDVLLPFVEQGDFTLIGATTENPSYELNRALLSRCRLVVFERLNDQDLAKLLQKSLRALHLRVEDIFQTESLPHFFSWTDGDGRKLVLASEELATQKLSEPEEFPLSQERLKARLGAFWLGYDRQSDQHYDNISAFIKSIRGSDADAGLYYLARMLKGGEDPIFIARRLVILASEDVGNADPRAMQMAISGAQAVEMIGLPEAAISLAQVVTYLASAPKSNRSYLALKKAQAFVENTGTRNIPLKLRSSKTTEMQDLGYGKDYKYPHDYPRHFVEQNYWPESVEPQKFYEPHDIGFEKQILAYHQWLKGNSNS
jgi:putative ATPase